MMRLARPPRADRCRCWRCRRARILPEVGQGRFRIPSVSTVRHSARDGCLCRSFLRFPFECFGSCSRGASAREPLSTGREHFERSTAGCLPFMANHPHCAQQTLGVRRAPFPGCEVVCRRLGSNPSVRPTSASTDRITLRKCDFSAILACEVVLRLICFVGDYRLQA